MDGGWLNWRLLDLLLTLAKAQSVPVAASAPVSAQGVKDNGPSIPLAACVRVFDQFCKIMGSEQIWAGLGLSIVQTISRRIGTEIRFVFSDRGKLVWASPFSFLLLPRFQALAEVGSRCALKDY